MVPETQDIIKEHLKKAKFEYAFFNRTSHVFNITTRIEDTAQTLSHLRLNPNINTSTVLSNTF